MGSGITLTAGVRQNLLSLQNTADLISQTQNRLATGKKVNSALDNPTSFFTSQSLNNRAGDLNNLLDSIGQAQKTLDAANTGLTSLTKLLQSAKSIAQQARQSSGPTAVTYGAIAVNDTTQTETLGTTGNGAAITVADSTTYSFNVNLSGAGAQTVTFTSGLGATYGQILAGLQASFATAATADGFTAGTDVSLVANTAGDGIKINALKADVDIVVSANSGAGLTNGTYNSTSLLDRVTTAGGTAGSSTLTVAVNGGSNQVITFGTAAGQVSTLADLSSALGGLTGVTAGVTGNALSFSVASSATANSLTLTGSAGVTTALGLTNGTSNGVASVSTPDSTRTSLQSDYNNVLSQIDSLAKDSSYNGVNLLYGDDLKVVFNEKGTSTLTISGVTFDSAGLALSAVTGTSFQSNANIDAAIASLDKALSALRSQASRFGSTLNTVQTRQDFTKSLINTLQTGADVLVLADSNEEGANMLALQTRQSLSTTALSLANQASQAVLRLFQ
jgi:flagellin-like hook-associated protein FlgL